MDLTTRPRILLLGLDQLNPDKGMKLITTDEALIRLEKIKNIVERIHRRRPKYRLNNRHLAVLMVLPLSQLDDISDDMILENMSDLVGYMVQTKMVVAQSKQSASPEHEHRNSDAEKACLKRDTSSCVITKSMEVEVCPILPFAWTSSEDNLRTCGSVLIPGARLVADEFSEETVMATLTPDVAAIDEPWNMITLKRTLHACWGAANFGLKYVGEKPAETLGPEGPGISFQLQLVWLSQSLSKPDDFPKLDQDGIEYFLKNVEPCNKSKNETRCETGHSIQSESSRLFSITIPEADAKKFSLVIKLQWALLRVAAMCTAAGEPSDHYCHFDDDGNLPLGPEPVGDEYDSEEEPVLLTRKRTPGMARAAAAVDTCCP